jgi:hypothetical protein
MKRFWKTAACVTALLMAIGLFAGCSSSVNGNDDETEKYRLWITLERDLESGQDYVEVTYRTADGEQTHGVVEVGGIVISAFASDGKASHLIKVPTWETGNWIPIVARDSLGEVIHRDSVIIPGEFTITSVFPAIGIWRPSDATLLVDWSPSANAVNYTLSVKPRNNQLAKGYADYHETQQALSATFTQEVFRDDFDYVYDLYDVHIIAFNPNFIPRDDAPYKVPEFPASQIADPITGSRVVGGISALTVSERETIEVVAD